VRHLTDSVWFAPLASVIPLSSQRTTRQGLTLVHFSAQLEPCLTHTNPPKHPKHPLNMGYTTPKRTPYPIESAQVELRSERV